jgi:hypothetical protein
MMYGTLIIRMSGFAPEPVAPKAPTGLSHDRAVSSAVTWRPEMVVPSSLESQEPEERSGPEHLVPRTSLCLCLQRVVYCPVRRSRDGCSELVGHFLEATSEPDLQLYRERVQVLTPAENCHQLTVGSLSSH